MSIPYISKDCAVGMAIQSTWGTPVADNAAVIQLDIDEPVHFPREGNRRTNPGATGCRWKVSGDYAIDHYGIMTRFTIKGEAKWDELDILMYAHAQKVVEGASTPYAKTITRDTSAPQPDFAADAGFKLTFFFLDPVAADSWKIKDCIVENLKIMAQPGGPIKYEAVIVGRGIPVTSTPSGTWTRSANQFWFWDTSVRRTVNFGSGAVDLELSSAGYTIELAQKIDKYGQNTDGSFKGYTISEIVPKFSITVHKDDNLADAITAYDNQTLITFNLAHGNATAGTVDGDLDFTFTAILDEPQRVFADPHYEATFAGEIASANKSTTPFTIIIANAVDRSW